MAAKMKLKSFLLPPEMDRGLKALKERDGVPEGVAIRRAIALFLADMGVDPNDQPATGATTNQPRSRSTRPTGGRR